MRLSKPIVYCLILCGLLVLAWVGISAGDAGAHYQNADSWYSVVYPTEELQLQSNCLVKNGQTVLLGQMELAEKEIPFTISTNAVAVGTFSCSVAEDAYISAELIIDEAVYAGETPIALDTRGKTVLLKLIPTQTALETIHEAMDIHVTVTFTSGSEQISGTFLATLPALTELPEPTVPETTVPEVTEPETTEPEVTEPEVTEPEVTEPEATEPEATEPEVTESETTEPQEDEPAALTETEPTENPTEPSENPSEPSEDPSEPSEDPSEPSEDPSDPSEDPSEPSEDPTDPSEDPTDPSEDPSEPSEDPADPTDPVQPESAVVLTGPGAYIPGYIFPLSVEVPAETTLLRLTLADAQGTLQSMPPFTRYSYDGGASWFMLYYGGLIELPWDATSVPVVLLDLSGTALGEDESLTLLADASAGETLLGIGKLTVVTASGPDTQPQMLTAKNTVTLELPEAWRGCAMTFTVARLTESKQTITAEDGTTTSRIVREYVDVPLTPETLTAEHNIGDDTTPANTLTFRTGTPKETEALWQTLPAGTYRVSLNWTYQEIGFASEQITLFINYSPDVP